MRCHSIHFDAPQVPADGVVTWGSSHVNESMITGEARPVSKHVGDSVITGTLNTHGALHVRAVHVGGDTALAQVSTRPRKQDEARTWADVCVLEHRRVLSSKLTVLLSSQVGLVKWAFVQPQPMPVSCCSLRLYLGRISMLSSCHVLL